MDLIFRGPNQNLLSPPKCFKLSLKVGFVEKNLGYGIKFPGCLDRPGQD